MVASKLALVAFTLLRAVRPRVVTLTVIATTYDLAQFEAVIALKARAILQRPSRKQSGSSY
jgi:hypothetical protein